MKSCTVREIGGEVWATLVSEKSQPDIETEIWEELSIELETALLDLVMGILARHVGEIITNDSDFPMEARPYT